MFRTITARYAGTCKRCRQGFDAGTRIRFGGYGRTYHLSASCPAGQRNDHITTDYAPEAHDARPEYGSQTWAETRADDLGESPDF